MADKYRYWACVVYPESLPEDYITQMRLTGIRYAISPLHDKDFNADGELKKSHYHILIAYDGPTTFNAVSKAISFLNGTIPIPLQSPRGYYRYFCHLDNPEKAQYNEMDIVCLNGFDISEYFSSSDINVIINQITDVILDNDISEYRSLLLWCRDNKPEWSSIVSSHTIHFNALCRSVRHSRGAYYDAPLESLVPSDERI